MRKLYYTYTILGLISLALWGGCKTEYPDLPYAEIETFTIEDAYGEPLHAVIKGEEIIIYWTPLEDEPESISPVIKVSEGASIAPASGEEVPYTAETQYTVTAQDGTKKTYNLRTEGGQPVPYINSIPFKEIYINSSFVIRGDYFQPDAAKTKVYLLAGQQEYEMTEFSYLTNSNLSVIIPITTELDTGFYNVKVVTGRYTLLPQDEVHLNAPYLSLLLDKTKLPPTTINPGQTFSLYFTHEQALKFYQESDFTGKLSAYDSGDMQDFNPQVKFVNAQELQVTIPTNMATGSYLFYLYTGQSLEGSISYPLNIE